MISDYILSVFLRFIHIYGCRRFIISAVQSAALLCGQTQFFKTCSVLGDRVQLGVFVGPRKQARKM